MHGEAVSVDIMDGDMEWVRLDIMVDMGELETIVDKNELKNI